MRIGGSVTLSRVVDSRELASASGPLEQAGEQMYSTEFYEKIRTGSQSSAEALVPAVLQLVHPKSVVDVGCGDGTWLSVFREFGVTDTLGIDGEYVDRGLLRIPQDEFRAVDLSEPFKLGRSFDLAISLEVAEHLPPNSAQTFVASLTALAPIVLFSAAIPFQGGTRHLNEQWPDYWGALFERHNYVPIDCIRQKLWNNDDVEFWYIQNCLIFASSSFVQDNDVLRTAYQATNPRGLRMVHPRGYLRATLPLAETPQLGVRDAWGLFVKTLNRAARRRLQRFAL